MGFEVFLKVPVIIIIKFGENNVIWPIYIYFIYRYITIFGVRVVGDGSPDILLLIIHKNGKITRASLPILKPNSTLF